MSNWNCCIKQKSAKKELGRSYWFPHTACCPCFDAYDLFCDDAYDWWACMLAPVRAGVCQMLGLYAVAAGTVQIIYNMRGWQLQGEVAVAQILGTACPAPFHLVRASQRRSLPSVCLAPTTTRRLYELTWGVLLVAA